jgi:UDP-N-acetylmuramyl pentapeptide phosphotransferase/UDP-N-acetylglucosamine-1-phosphate transferase
MNDAIGAVSAAAGATTTVIAAAASVALIVGLRPWLRRYALARPNARSSHREPTPQGGGIAVATATIATAYVIVGFWPPCGAMVAPLHGIFAGAVLMACLGAADDIRPLAVAPRLMLQALIVAGVIYWLPEQWRIFPPLPLWIERSLLVLGGLWFVNLVNFMDGIDWMTVAEVVPLSACLFVLGQLHALPAYGAVAAAALGGAMLGFAYFNRPTAKLFLGDVGSLPIGLLLGWLLLLLATGGHLVAAIVMPLYYLADATVTVLRRLARREPVWQAHRTHFYQLATDRGFTVMEVVAFVFAANVGLCALACLSVIVPGGFSDFVALAGGAILVAGLLAVFARGKAAAGRETGAEEE